MSSFVHLCTIWVVVIHLAKVHQCFYLPGTAPKDFSASEAIDLKVRVDLLIMLGWSTSRKLLRYLMNKVAHAWVRNHKPLKTIWIKLNKKNKFDFYLIINRVLFTFLRWSLKIWKGLWFYIFCNHLSFLGCEVGKYQNSTSIWILLSAFLSASWRS